MYENILAVIPHVLGLYSRNKLIFSGKNLLKYANEYSCHLAVNYKKGYWQLSRTDKSTHLSRPEHNHHKFIGCDIKPFED